ncbi:MAG TPA: SGNH/GDSL hydrolase family protein [Candidatus Nanopelagicales bacterium]
MARWNRRLVAGIATLALTAAAVAPAEAAPDAAPTPTAVTALGDSITIAYDIRRLLAADPSYSWATGTQTAVSSVASRLDARDTATAITRANVAASGAKASALVTQAGSVTAGTLGGTELVTVLMGANDACTRTESEMTPVSTFRTQVAAGLDALVGRGVDRIAVASIPNIYQLWQVGRTSSSARFVWSLYSICQSMLRNAGSTSSTDEARRQRVRQRVVDFNTVLREECARITATAPATSCRDDGGAVFATAFTLKDISTVDYFHPSVAGQAKLAATTYPAFGYPTG